MKYLTIYFQVAPEEYCHIDVDAELFSKVGPDTITLNGAIVHLPGRIVDVRSRMPRTEDILDKDKK